MLVNPAHKLRLHFLVPGFTTNPYLNLANATCNLTFGLSAYVMDCDEEAHEAGPAKTSGKSKASMTRNWVATQRVIRKANMNYNRAHSNDVVHDVFHYRPVELLIGVENYFLIRGFPKTGRGRADITIMTLLISQSQPRPCYLVPTKVECSAEWDPPSMNRAPPWW